MFKDKEIPSFECVTHETINSECFTDCGPMDYCSPDDDCNPDKNCQPDK